MYFFMENARIVIVDDSVFSIGYIKSVLENNKFEVVGQASNLEEVKKVVKETKPTLVTMDMTLPGTDGFECTRAIHEIDKNIKVIVISSIMDDELIKEAKKNRVSAYIQKPIDDDELIATINKVIGVDELYSFLEKEYFSVFKEAMMDGLNKMTKTMLTYKNEQSCLTEYELSGVAVIIAIIGKFSGRMLIDLSKETANNIASAIFRKENVNNDEMTAALGEFANIVAGNACSILNRQNKALGLRLAPPSILTGDNVLISNPTFNTKTVVGQTNFGDLMLDVGFTRGEDEWM